MLVEGSPLNDREYSTDEGVVKDPLYEEVVEHGNEEYKPPPKEPSDEEPEVTVDPATKSPPGLRPSTHAVREAKGLYEENENEFENGPSLTEGDVPDNADIDSSRQLSSLVAASHRQSSGVESKRQSAEKASKLHEEITGNPLEIGERRSSY
ncbi:2777_t:CDS:2 [Racocetra persica]|uniref:2777_t:CDS:1 n=1 Tax=Racocetra persica TaxID=160502 RepID=A0ACA9LRL7_9GLOM|nr:2777_t:CDS:2 [Racocetra persica]